MSRTELYSKAINIVDNANAGNQAMANEQFDALDAELNEVRELKAFDKEWDLVTINKYGNGHIVYTQRWTTAEWNDAEIIELSRNGEAIAFEHYKIDAVTGKRKDI